MFCNEGLFVILSCCCCCWFLLWCKKRLPIILSEARTDFDRFKLTFFRRSVVISVILFVSLFTLPITSSTSILYCTHGIIVSFKFFCRRDHASARVHANGLRMAYYYWLLVWMFLTAVRPVMVFLECGTKLTRGDITISMLDGVVGLKGG